MKIYTKIGDKGETLLANGSHVKKSSLRIDAYGTVDELNAHMGHLRDFMQQEKISHPLHTKLIETIFRIQNELFELGAELALAPMMQKIEHIDNAAIKRLEDEIDVFWNAVPPLKNFVLPGGHVGNSQAHICRCVCRRCERILCKLHDEDFIRPDILIYFNRLSDWLFACSRMIHQIYGIKELIWEARSIKEQSSTTP